MNILFAVQGTGNGHLSRAKDIYPELCRYGHVDVLVSGYQCDVQVPFPVRYRLKGLSFIFGGRGGVDLRETVRRLRPFRFFRDVAALPVADYDLVVNDFEPVSAWACRIRGVPCIACSHQSAVIQAGAPRPRANGWVGRFLLRHYAPFTRSYGFHFISNPALHIFPPVIRKEIQQLQPCAGQHYTVYLPAYEDHILEKYLQRFPDVEWHIFSKHSTGRSYVHKNLFVRPVENNAFLQSLASCCGALLGAGFEGPAEALFLQKKVLVIPMKNQYEQQCNAAALARLGIPVLPELTDRHFPVLAEWVQSGTAARISFPEDTARVAVAALMEPFTAVS